MKISRKLAKAINRAAKAHDLRKTFDGYREAAYTSFPVTRDIGRHVLPNGRNSKEDAKSIMESTPRVFFSREEIVDCLKEHKIEIINLVNTLEKNVADKFYEVGSVKYLAAKTRIDELKSFIRSMKQRYQIEEGELKVHDMLEARAREQELAEIRQLRDATELHGGEWIPETET